MSVDHVDHVSAADLAGNWEFALKILDDVTYARGTWKVDAGNVSGMLATTR